MNKISLHFVFAFIVFASLRLSAQENFKKTLQVNGRIHYDYEFLKRENSTGWFNGNEFRRVYISFSGKIAPKLKYKVETDISTGKISFRDMYIKYLAGKYGNFGVGSITEPTGLDMATSSKYSPFAERAMLTSMQNFRWGSGLHYENFHLFDGKAGIQLAITDNGSHLAGFKDTELEKGMNYVARFSGLILQNTEQKLLLHLGINYADRPASTLKFRSENHMGEKYVYEMPGAKRNIITGTEAAFNYRSFSFQTEFKTERSKDTDINWNYRTSGYYLMGSYFLTGEYRPYKNGAFDRVNPIKDISHGGYGAFEVLLRYSEMNFSDELLSVNPFEAPSVSNITFGVNWYLTSHARIMYNYVLTDDHNHSLGKLSGHIIRFAIDF